MTIIDYEAIPGVNYSSLKHIGEGGSPMLYKYRLEHPEEEKDDFVFGSAVHCAVFEPDLFGSRYAECDVVRNAKHEKFKEWMAAHPGAAAMTPSEMTLIRAMAKAVREDKNAGPLVRGGKYEHVITWTDEETGIRCKGRLDCLRNFVLDLKTTANPHPRPFLFDAIKFGYFGKMAFYHDGCVANGYIDGSTRPYVVAAGKSAPHEVVTYQLTPAALAGGRSIYRGLLRRLIECTEANYWPGAAPEIQQLDMPAWKMEQIISAESESEGF